MRPNQPPAHDLPYGLEDFEWPGQAMVYANIGMSNEFRIPEACARRLVEALRANPGAYASLQDHGALELNPNYSNHVTPQGLYGFPRGYLAHMAMHMACDTRTCIPTSGVEYAFRSNLFVFDIDGPVANSDTYSNTDLVRDLAMLGNLWTLDRVTAMRLGFAADTTGVSSMAASYMRSAHMHREEEHGQQFQYLIWATERCVDAMLPTTDNDGYRTHPDKPALWRHVLASLGYSAILDRHALLTGDIEQQVVVVDPARIRNLVHVPNPLNPGVRMAYQRELEGLVRNPGPGMR